MVEAGTAEEIADAVRGADTEGTPVLLVGGGSNLLVADDGWPGVAILMRSRGVGVRVGADDVALDAQAGEPWDDLVTRCVAEGWAGIECLAGIPGLVGATPVQNVGAYGQEIAEVLTGVRVWDRERAAVRDLGPEECGFGYRTSVFKGSERYVVLGVQLRLRRSGLAEPARYAELAARLGTGRAPLAAVREAVLDLRRGKGMVLDDADHDTWSAGSFFTNPVLDSGELSAFEARLAPGTAYPHWPAEGGTKLSAAWLIERAGFGRGYRAGRAAVSSKHTLALTNRGGASARELLALARTIAAAVRERFRVELRPEPRLVGVGL